MICLSIILSPPITSGMNPTRFVQRLAYTIEYSDIKHKSYYLILVVLRVPSSVQLIYVCMILI